jgi:subtilisin family serine protease
MPIFPNRLKHNSGAWMTIEPSRVLVSMKDADAGVKRLRDAGLESEQPGHVSATRDRGSRDATLNNTKTRRWMVTADGRPYDEARLAKVAGSDVEWVAPVYRLAAQHGDEYLSVLPHVVLIEFERSVSPAEQKETLARYGLVEDEKRSKYLGTLHYCVIKNLGKTSALDLLPKILADRKVVHDAHFETMPMYKPTAYVPSDPLWADQWDMVRIHAGGPGQTGWNLERGDPGVIICILDEGCDLNHPDLRFTPAPSGINLGTMAGDGSPTGNHGTACAGIAAARIQNATGVAGVAGGCTILPAAFDAWTDVEVAAGIRYAVASNARVISMSFGWDPWNHAIIDPAIQEAFDANLVMCVATHNYNGAVTYPATNPLVMACGASDQNDNRKTPASPDGEGWGSDFGPQVSVVAPGVLCPTTDRLGADGYVAGDYRMDFNGTSSATPHVAGLAALLISSASSLTNVEVRAIIESTADKVGAVAYAADPLHPNGTWNQEMGYGRINVLEAVRVVKKRCELDIKRILFEDKWFIPEEWGKLRHFKEKERGDEVKIVGYENPEIFDPRIYERLIERLDRLEKLVLRGQPFIRPEERPDVGRPVAERARRTPRASKSRR